MKISSIGGRTPPGRRTKLLVLSASLVLALQGCSAPPSARARLEKAYETYKEMNAQLDRLMDFTYALERLDLEDAGYKDRAEQALGESQERLSIIRSRMERLQGFDYGRELNSLQEAMRPFLEELGKALEEVESIIETAWEVLLALEPTLRVEAELTWLDPPENNQVQLERLLRLDAAISETLSRLEGIQPPEPMNLYKELNQEMWSSLQRTTRLLIQAIRGEIPITEQPSNPDFDRFQLILENYRELVRSIHDKLELYDLDELARRADAAFYRLFLEYGEEDL